MDVRRRQHLERPQPLQARGHARCQPRGMEGDHAGHPDDDVRRPAAVAAPGGAGVDLDQPGDAERVLRPEVGRAEVVQAEVLVEDRGLPGSAGGPPVAGREVREGRCRSRRQPGRRRVHDLPLDDRRPREPQPAGDVVGHPAVTGAVGGGGGALRPSGLRSVAASSAFDASHWFRTLTSVIRSRSGSGP